MTTPDTPRFCADCKWSREHDDRGDNWDGVPKLVLACGHPEVLDRVTGKPRRYCVEQRKEGWIACRLNNECGIEGRRWEAKA